MSLSYIKLHYDWIEVTSELTDSEKGRLIDAMIAYATGRPCELSGNERFLFPAFRAQVDRDKAAYDDISGKRRRAIESRWKQKNTSVYTCTQDKEEEEEKEEEQENTRARASAAEALPDTLEAYVSNNLVHLSPGNMEELASFKADLPEELIRYAVDEACANGKPRYSYLRAILNRYIEHGYKTIGDAKAAEEGRRKDGRQHDPDRSPTDAELWANLDPGRRKIFEDAWANGGAV